MGSPDLKNRFINAQGAVDNVKISEIGVKLKEIADEIFDFAQVRPKFLGINLKTQSYKDFLETTKTKTYDLGIDALGPAFIALTLAKRLNLRDHQEPLFKATAQVWKDTFAHGGVNSMMPDVLGFISVLVTEDDPVIQQTTADFFRAVYSENLDGSEDHQELVKGMMEEGYLELVLNKEDATQEREMVKGLLAPVKK